MRTFLVVPFTIFAFCGNSIWYDFNFSHNTSIYNIFWWSQKIFTVVCVIIKLFELTKAKKKWFCNISNLPVCARVCVHIALNPRIGLIKFGCYVHLAYISSQLFSLSYHLKICYDQKHTNVQFFQKSALTVLIKI